ncbi:hypothetical protein MKO06_07800 [Gramella sp. GC03-9]|uniref:Uncharacterized protein n=1 Tax=Christiangramia oceanisediminis TaxID=2920386 RepID=A0A9X2IBF2_9FLAO|nr:hypothetical protein [Gramella oceanisediminis]MCP9199803.1 hypothetical protein [Gramella oceanisediminis]
MQDYLDFLVERKVYVSLLMEFLAALAGSLYLIKAQSFGKLRKQFVWFLWSVFIIDILGGYSIWAYFDDYQTFPFLKDSLFTRSFWWYNLAKVYRIIVYCYLLYYLVREAYLRNFIKWGTILFIIYAVYNMVFSGQFFTTYIISTIIAGTFLIVVCVFLYFYDMLVSRYITGFSRNLFNYVFAGVLIWYLVIPPIEIFVNHFIEENELFIEVFATVLRYANILLYGTCILGFYMEYRSKKKSITSVEISSK